MNKFYRTTIFLLFIICLESAIFSLSFDDDDLIAYFQFEETDGTTAFDSSQYGNNASIIDSTLVTMEQTGIMGNAYTLAYANNNRIRIGEGYTSPINSFSFGGWFRATATHQVEGQTTSGTGGTSGQKYVFYPIHGGSDGTSAGVGLSIGTNGISVYEHAAAYMPAVNVYSGNIGSVWNHIMVTVENGTTKIYLNGVLVSTGLTSSRTTQIAPSTIGTETYESFAGDIDEITIWKRTLSSEEITDLYINGISGPLGEVPEVSNLSVLFAAIAIFCLSGFGKKMRKKI